jgi:hypothetical protein
MMAISENDMEAIRVVSGSVYDWLGLALGVLRGREDSCSKGAILAIEGAITANSVVYDAATRALNV